MNAPCIQLRVLGARVRAYVSVMSVFRSVDILMRQRGRTAGTALAPQPQHKPPKMYTVLICHLIVIGDGRIRGFIYKRDKQAHTRRQYAAEPVRWRRRRPA